MVRASAARASCLGLTASGFFEYLGKAKAVFILLKILIFQTLQRSPT